MEEELLRRAKEGDEQEVTRLIERAKESGEDIIVTVSS